MKVHAYVLIVTFLLGLVAGWSRVKNAKKGGLVPGKTIGEVWPLPQQIQQFSTYFNVDANSFEFVYQGIGCTIIDSAISRYQDLIFNPPRYAGCSSIRKNQTFAYPKEASGDLTKITIILNGNNCESKPYLGMNEQYELQVDSMSLPGQAQLTANSTWGIIRGLESFSQLIYHDGARNFFVNSTYIFDYPRFEFRGFLTDTARHYVPLSVIKQQLDALAFNKFNVFHWHITDDQSFPYESQAFPTMSEQGAYDPNTHVYSFDDITSVIKYAADRGIRVIPEFDSPGHTESWGLGIADLLTPCYTGAQPNGNYGPIDPSKNSTFDFLYQFFSEVARLFPDQYLHLGGDEVDFSCWESNPDIQAFMQEKGFGTDYALLETFYMNNLIDIVSSEITDKKYYIVWQEVFDNGGQLNPNTVVNVWKGNGYEDEMAAVTSSGFQTILSSCWYLNLINYGSDWKDYYACEPLSFNGTQSQYDLVVGGSGTMWAEYVDATNLIARTWPRASAVGERLWSDQSVTDTNAAAPRLEEHRCRMLERGINAEPFNGPNYCPSDYLVN